MSKQHEWGHKPHSALPQNRCCIKSKWMFKVKRNGVYQVSLVACSYNQIQGVIFGDLFTCGA